MGHTLEYAQERATEHLLAREEARAEQAIWTGDLGNTPNFTEGTDSGSGALEPRLALAEAEQYIATAYGSLGTIHMPRYVASILLGEMLLEVRGTRLYTRLGTPVIAGAGYRLEEHTSELQSLMRISYAVFCLKKKKANIHN